MFNILFNPKKAERKPITMMLVGFFYSSVSIFLAYLILPDYISLVMIFLSVISCLYVVQGSLKIEENKEYDFKPEKWLLLEHSRLILFLLFLFLGFVLSFTFWSFILPAEITHKVFALQISIVEGIRNMIATGNVINQEVFFKIIFNNIKVLFISLILAFFYGAGAIFVLVWNASIMGLVIGELARNSFGLVALPFAFAKYFLHGIPEMMSYLIASIAGGIMYVALFKGDFFKEGRMRRIIIDCTILIIISIILLFIAAFIEVYISPYI